MSSSKAREASAVPLKILVCFILVLLSVTILPKTLAASPSIMYTFGSNLDDGNSVSEYTLFYSIPPVIQAGVPTNLTMYLYITELTGWKYYVNNMYIIFTADVSQEPNAVFTQKVENNVTSYQGNRWGPFNVTVDLTNAELGIKAGQSSTVNFYADLTSNEKWNDPYFNLVYPVEASMELNGNYTVSASQTAPPVSHHDATAFAVGAIVVAGLTVTVLATRRKSPAASSL